MDAQPVLHYDVAYPDRLSRGLLFIKWLLIIPHLLVLGFVMLGLLFTTLIAWVAILITGRYPRGLFDFATMTLRWMARVNAYFWHQRDEYPPFGDGDYPVRFDLAYPTRLSRLLIFVKGLLIIPHWIVLYLIGMVAGIIWYIAWFAILFTGRYPEGLFNFVTGYCRWSYRVTVYALLLTDAYPPFSMDEGSAPPEPALGVAPASTF